MYELDTAMVKGKCCKRSPSWKGPGIIVKKLTPHLYQVKTKSAVIVANHDCLKKCVDRDIPPWLVRFRENFENSESAKQETGSVLASSPPAGAAGACKLPESPSGSSHAEVGPQNTLLLPEGLLTVLPSPPPRHQGRPRNQNLM